MNTETIIVLRSATHSIKAKRLLAEHGIGSRSIKPPTDGDKGCSYGISVAAPSLDSAARILKSAKVPIIKIVK